MLRIAINEPKPFQLHSPDSLEHAADLGGRLWPDAAYMAGGCDLIDRLKHQLQNPRNIINLKGIKALHGVQDKGNTLLIGALTKLSDIERDMHLHKSMPALALAASRVATPQIRNLGTVGGNLLQDSRCPYYRGAWYCYRAGGIECYAHHGLNYEHAVFGGDRCWTVTPSDLAPVMVALHATIHARTGDGNISFPAHHLFSWAGDDIRHLHKLHSGQILTGIEIPVRKNQISMFIKNAPRNAWDFSRASVALSAEKTAGKLHNWRVVMGGVSSVPWRSRDAENVLENNSLSDSVIEAAAKATSTGAAPVRDSEYKVPLVRKLVRQALQQMQQV